MQDVSIGDLKRMLIMAAISPSYLRVGEGRRFLSFLFGLDEQLVKELIVIVRAQIPFGRRCLTCRPSTYTLLVVSCSFTPLFCFFLNRVYLD